MSDICRALRACVLPCGVSSMVAARNAHAQKGLRRQAVISVRRVSARWSQSTIAFSMPRATISTLSQRKPHSALQKRCRRRGQSTWERGALASAQPWGLGLGGRPATLDSQCPCGWRAANWKPRTPGSAERSGNCLASDQGMAKPLRHPRPCHRRCYHSWPVWRDRHLARHWRTREEHHSARVLRVACAAMDSPRPRPRRGSYASPQTIPVGWWT
ncbi:hypothetical protein CC85DRAFT_17669 [Cutaneotrichosporon oleaginosum]|uniref:Uncharacterized protein n=1 Tax=Cutaneotrichosporon oleaginosum TaxID=879819 RepID=A0A0J0XTK9_9TREE|nr:uncharacterized protein CC85DRAFT_17669 [Cutaneotrichosporon oleaginosum]KLT44413.1 hypothetical protein CC85DRAFT_17669 [Cutaneotrichosporon oleaginosum]